MERVTLRYMKEERRKATGHTGHPRAKRRSTSATFSPKPEGGTRQLRPRSRRSSTLRLALTLALQHVTSDPGSSVTAISLKSSPFEHRPPDTAIKDNDPKRGHQEHPQTLVRVDRDSRAKPPPWRGRGRSKGAVLLPQIQASVAEITDNGRRLLQGEERLTLVHHLPIHPVKSRVARPCTELSALLAGVEDQIESKAARSTKIDVFAGRTHLGHDGYRRGADSPNLWRDLRARFEAKGHKSSQACAATPTKAPCQVSLRSTGGRTQASHLGATPPFFASILSARRCQGIGKTQPSLTRAGHAIAKV